MVGRIQVVSTFLTKILDFCTLMPFLSHQIRLVTILPSKDFFSGPGIFGEIGSDEVPGQRQFFDSVNIVMARFLTRCIHDNILTNLAETYYLQILTPSVNCLAICDTLDAAGLILDFLEAI